MTFVIGNSADVGEQNFWEMNEGGFYGMTKSKGVALVTMPLDAAPRVRVTYRDTDQMGHAYYANYLVWFEIGRTELLRFMGRRYRDWERQGVHLPVASCWIDYKRGALYDDVVRIEPRVTAISRASITFEYDIVDDETGQLLATGGTKHPFVSDDRRIARVAAQMLPELFP